MGSVGVNRTNNSMSIAGREFTKTTYYIFKNGKLHRNVKTGLIEESKRPYRIAGNYNLYVNSFPQAAQPHSIYLVADKNTGLVYKYEAISNGTEREYIKKLVSELKLK